MGLLEKLKKSERKVGSEFDKNEADEIFDALDKMDDSKKVSTEMKKVMNHVKDVSKILDEAKDSEKSGDIDNAIKLYKQVITIDPQNSKAYEYLADIYGKQNDDDNKIQILKLAVSNLKGSDKSKFMDMLKKMKN